MRKKDNNKKFTASELRDIHVAKIALLGAAIVVIGDGVGALAAALALDALENPISDDSDTRGSSNQQLQQTQAEIDYYINELMQIRDSLK